jgi:hypothetical protein
MGLLGETPQISGSVVLIILLILAGGLVVAGVGCVQALRAGRGDQTALKVWAVIAAIEVVLSLSGFLVVFGPALLVQVGLYGVGRATSPPPGGGPGGSTTPPPGS